MKVKILFLAALILFSFIACSFISKFEDPQAKIRDDYIKLVKQYTDKSETFEFAYMGSALMIKNFYLAPKVIATANSRWEKDPVFQEEMKKWYDGDLNNNNIIVLAGIYSPKFKEEDLTKTKRFRVSLKLANGQFIESSKIISYKKNSKFMADYFPTFTPWERVFMLQFKPGELADKYAADMKCIFYWPGGEEELDLIVFTE